VPAYDYLNDHLKKDGFTLTVASEGVQKGSTDIVEFDHREMPLNFMGLSGLIALEKCDTVISLVRLRYAYFFSADVAAVFLAFLQERGVAVTTFSQLVAPEPQLSY
jgi:hypothetical protein